MARRGRIFWLWLHDGETKFVPIVCLPVTLEIMRRRSLSPVRPRLLTRQGDTHHDLRIPTLDSPRKPHAPQEPEGP